MEIFWELKLLFLSTTIYSEQAQLRRLHPHQHQFKYTLSILIPSFYFALVKTHAKGKMLSLRTLARASPRVIPRLTPTVARALPRASPIALRANAFSTARVLLAESGEVDAQLSAKLESEIQFEAEVAKEEQMPGSIRDFIDQGKYEVLDVEGKEEVKLVRNFGDEK